MAYQSAAIGISRRPAKENKQGGVTLIEMALITPVFLMLMIGVIEMSMAYFANMTMQHAVREGARYAITGSRTAIRPAPTGSATRRSFNR